MGTSPGDSGGPSFIGTRTVSYTHLDVYKRQYQGRTEDALNVYENLIQEHSDDFRPLVGKHYFSNNRGK
ncbi:hypothetical protein CKA32_006841 [Geitlerinema sp. FC II]|nr:hypothetical protein CKA32_006841 [Geitlerinema sp. FC II]